MAVWLDAVGITAPGLPGWAQARAVLAGERSYRAEPLAPPHSTLLGATERRRVTNVIKLALQTAEDALGATHVPTDCLCSVFASSCGDTEIVDRICTALSMPERPVSPTQFHNSVHNAPAGYWSLGAGVRMPSTSIAAYDHTFAAGLLEAWTMVDVEGQSVLLVCYDWPPPAPLHAHRPLADAFATALVLSHEPHTDSGLTIDLRIESGAAAVMADAALEGLRQSNPAARALPLLQVIAAGVSATVPLPYGAGQVLSVQCQSH